MIVNDLWPRVTLTTAQTVALKLVSELFPDDDNSSRDYWEVGDAARATLRDAQPENQPQLVQVRGTKTSTVSNSREESVMTQATVHDPKIQSFQGDVPGKVVQKPEPTARHREVVLERYVDTGPSVRLECAIRSFEGQWRTTEGGRTTWEALYNENASPWVVRMP